MNSFDKYQYSSLGENQLRLLRPDHDLSSRELNFTVCHVSRDEAIKYTAVSYAWGSEEPTETIQLDGKVFLVRPHLWSCLFYLSRARPEIPSYMQWEHIWVDAISINQEDNSEKSSQVFSMHYTYHRAEVVSIWLGLVPFPKALSHGALRSAETILTYEDENFDWADHLQELLNRPYWERYWVIQEFLLARRGHVYCSDNAISWQRLRQLLHMKTQDAPPNIFHDRKGHLKAISTISKTCSAAPILWARTTECWSNGALLNFKYRLHTLLILYRHAKCKDRRDRVFALLGILRQEERQALERFFPDYSLDDDQVVVIALAHLMYFGHRTDSSNLYKAFDLNTNDELKGVLERARRFPYSDGLENRSSVDGFLTDSSDETENGDETDSGDETQSSHGIDSVANQGDFTAGAGDRLVKAIDRHT